MQKEQVLTNSINNDNVLAFKQPETRPALITGGPIGPENWLKERAKGNIFLARQKNSKELILNLYMIVEHKTQSSHIVWNMPDGRVLDIWVPTLEFSRQFDLHEIIAEKVEFTYEQETGADNASTMEHETEGLGPLPAPSSGSEEGKGASPES